MHSQIQQFIEAHPVFTWDEFVGALGDTRTEHTLRTHIKYYLQTGKIAQVKSGLYYRRSSGTGQTTPDKYLIGSKIAPDGVLGYRTAFEVLGYAHTVSTTVYVMTAFRRRRMQFQQVEYCPVAFPALQGSTEEHAVGCEQLERVGQKVTLTGKERTLIDGLDRPEYAGGHEELSRCIEKIPYLDFDVLVEYLHVRGKKILYAKTGFILEQYRDEWLVQDEWLTALESHTPKSPAYFGSDRTGTLINRWNIIVPDSLQTTTESA